MNICHMNSTYRPLVQQNERIVPHAYVSPTCVLYKCLLERGIREIVSKALELAETSGDQGTPMYYPTKSG